MVPDLVQGTVPNYSRGHFSIREEQAYTLTYVDEQEDLCQEYEVQEYANLTNQNIDVPTEYAYLNQELAPFSLYENGIGLPLSLYTIGPFLELATQQSPPTHIAL